MIPNYKKVHRRFKLNNYHYTFEDLMEVAYSFVKEGEPYQQRLGEFLLDWLDNKDYIISKTSGSTGKPKHLKIKKQAMVNSAIMTGNFFNLEPKNTALNCLPSNFIAGKMMIVRAIVLGLRLDLVKPSTHPLIDYRKTYNFCAFTPMQLKFFLKHTDNIKTIIVGGAPVSKSLFHAIQNIKSNVYETFGMTETVSHIAFKKLNNFNEDDTNLESLTFKTLPEIRVSQDNRDCLVIEAPKLSEEKIMTNDIVTLISESEFKWQGRLDNVMNSGGIKLFPEQIERKLQNKIRERFFIASQPDDTLGERVILIVEGHNTVDTSIFSELDTFEKPKDIYNIEKFAETASGKVHRKNTLKLV